MFIETSENRFTTKDALVEVYQCPDGTWRVAYYPYSDKDRNLTRKEAFLLAEQRHKEALEIMAKGLNMELTRSIWNKDRYDYLSLEDSLLYDKVKDSEDPKDQDIKRLILDKALASRGAHCASTY